MPPPCFSCSFSPTPLRWFPQQSFPTGNWALIMHWHKVTELILINRTQRSLTPHSPLPSLLYSYLCRPPSLCSCDSLANQFSSWKLEFHRKLKLASSVGKVFRLPPSLPLLILSFGIFNTLILNPVDLSPAVHYLLNKSHFILNRLNWLNRQYLFFKCILYYFNEVSSETGLSTLKIF